MTLVYTACTLNAHDDVLAVRNMLRHPEKNVDTRLATPLIDPKLDRHWFYCRFDDHLASDATSPAQIINDARATIPESTQIRLCRTYLNYTPAPAGEGDHSEEL